VISIDDISVYAGTPFEVKVEDVTEQLGMLGSICLVM